MNDEVRIRVTEEAGHAPLVTVTGPLDLYNGPRLYRPAARVLERHPSLVLDLAGACDSSGLNTVLRLCRRAREARGRLLLLCPPDVLDRLPPLTDRDGAMVVHASVAEARSGNLTA